MQTDKTRMNSIASHWKSKYQCELMVFSLIETNINQGMCVGMLTSSLHWQGLGVATPQ